MTALDLYKYVQDNDIEWHWVAIDEGVWNVFLMPYIFQVEEFAALMDSGIFEDGLSCTLKGNYMVFEMQEICDYFGIEITEVFTTKHRS